jgi:hypothetical protein
MRYIRTKDHVRRRLTLHHVESMRWARKATTTIPGVTIHDWLEIAHGSGWAGIRGIKPYAYPKLLQRRRTMIAAGWEVTL